uniref:Phosphatidylinositol-glycan biosynthesis class F protein n=1 Tax=Arcella intermedia TaxID=1963864 RepID=A0A6B2LR49_9EUKA
MVGLVVGSVLFSAVAVLYGAPLTSDLTRTWLWGTLVSALTCFPGLLVNDVDSILRVYVDRNVKGKAERWCLVSAVGTLVGCWLGALPIPLDSDRPWQVWPISCTYGALGGFYLSHIVFFVFQSCSKNNKQRLD